MDFLPPTSPLSKPCSTSAARQSFKDVTLGDFQDIQWLGLCTFTVLAPGGKKSKSYSDEVSLSSYSNLFFFFEYLFIWRCWVFKFFFFYFIFNWRIIALQYCIGFCHISVLGPSCTFLGCLLQHSGPSHKSYMLPALKVF